MKQEPTLQEVLESMNKRFNMLFAELERTNKLFDFTNSQLHLLREDVKEVRETQKADGEVLDEVRDTLGAISKAVDKDAVTIVSHERRILLLEKSRA